MEQARSYSKLRTFRYVLWGLIAAGTTGWGLVYVTADQKSGTDDAMSAEDAMRASIKSEFTLVNHSGETVTNETFTGKWRLVFFGFTSCPDVCPTTLNTIAEVMEQLGETAVNLQPLFITVDPERDAPARMAEYVGAFDPRIIGLTGTAEQVKNATESFKIYYAKVPLEGTDGDYTMDHTAYLYLMNGSGEFEAFFSDHNGARDIAKNILERLQS